MIVKAIYAENPSDNRELELLIGEVRADGENVAEFHWGEEDTNDLAKIYDIYQAPALLITKDDGVYVELWQGSLPTAGEVRYRLNNA